MKLSQSWKIFIIFILGFLVYANILGNGFVWDDEEQVVGNNAIRSLTNIPALFSSSTFNSGGSGGLSGAYYKPFMPALFAINFSLFGLNATIFHLIQLLIHLSNAILVFLILKNILKSENKAFFVCLIWVIHPGISEAVIYVSAYQDVLFAFFGLLGFWLSLRFINTKNLNFLFAAFFSLFCSLLSKEAGVIFLVLISLYFLLFNIKNLLKFVSGSAFILGIYLFTRLVIAKISFSAPHIVPIAKATFSQRLLTLPFELFSYLRLAVFPKDLFISQHQLVTNFSDSRFWGLGLFILLLFIIFAGFYIKTKNKLLLFFGLWFFISLGPTLNIIPADMTISERWLYIPLIGFLSVLILLITNYYLLIIFVVFLATRTFLRTFDWRDGLTLYQNDIKLNPNAFDLQNNYGVELFRNGKLSDALIHFKKSIELSPEWWTNYNNCGAIYQARNNLKVARNYYQKSIDNGNYYLAYENQAFLILRTDGPDKAIKFINESLRYLPLNSKLHLVAALSYNAKNQNESALKFSQKAFQLSPNEQTAAVLQAIMQGKKIVY